MLIRVGARHDCGMPDRSDRACVRLVRVTERCAFVEQTTQAALTKLVAITVQLLSWEAVYDDDHEKFRGGYSGSTRITRHCADNETGKNRGDDEKLMHGT